jgi:GH15 family glucan-1,4-alpha-glucosidase
MRLIAARHDPGACNALQASAEKIRQEMVARAWRDDIGGFASHFGGTDLDASLLQIAPLRFLAPDDPRLSSTIDAIVSNLSADGWLFRYRLDDGFGRPAVAFVICTFWLVEALAVVGRKDEARRVFEYALNALSPVGLLAEDWETGTSRMWGNFPQAYSHVGLIHAAFAASPRWQDVL